MSKSTSSIIVIFLLLLSISFASAAIVSVDLTSPATDSWTADATPTLSFNASSDILLSFNCTLNIDSIPNTTLTDVVNESITPIIPSINLIDGTHAWTVNCTDDADATYLESASRNIKIDTTAPTTTDSGTDAAWHNASVSVTLSCNDGTGIGCDDTLYCVDQANACSPSTLYTVPVAIATEGINYIRFKSNDTLNNTEGVQSGDNTIKIDTTAPTTTDSGTDANWHNASVSVTLSCNDGTGSSCDDTLYCVDQANACSPSTLYTVPVAISAEGINYIRFLSNDTLNNTEVVQSGDNTIKIDTAAPTTTDSGTDTNWHNASVSVTLSCDAAGASACDDTIYCIDQANICTPALVYAGPISVSTEGINFVRFISNDTAGNIETVQSADNTVKIDTTAPTTTDSGTDANWHNASISVTLSCSDGVNASNISGCNATLYCIDQADGCAPNISYSGPISVSTEGINYVRFRSNDSQANYETVQSADNTVKIDTTAPTTTDSGTDANWHNASVSVTLSCNDGTGSSCDDTLYCVDQANACSPSTLYTVPVAIATEGINYIRFLSNDTLNNTEVVQSGDNSIKIDTTAPTTTDSGTDTNWHNASVSVTLSCSDGANASNVSGCNATLYCVDQVNGCAPSTLYSGPISVSTDGINYVRFRSNDSQANYETVQSADNTVKIDTTAPTTTDSGTDANWHNASVSVTLSCNDGANASNVSGCNATLYCVDQVNSCAPSILYSGPVSVSTEGINYVRFRSNDTQANYETVQSADNTVKIDTAAPTTTDSGTDTNWHNASVSVTLSCSDGANASNVSGCNATLYCVDQANSCAPSTLYSGPVSVSTEGINYVRFRSNDTQANYETVQSADNTVKIDTAAPTTTDSGTDANWHNASVSVTLSCNDGANASNVSGCNATLYCIDQVNGCAPSTLYSGPISVSAEGINYVRFRSNDTANNLEDTQSTDNTIMIDTVAPSLTWVSPANGNTYASGETIAVELNVTETGSLIYEPATCIVSGTSASGSLTYSNITNKCTGNITAGGITGNITVSLTDTVNNTGTSEGRMLAIDDSPIVINSFTVSPDNFVCALNGDDSDLNRNLTIYANLTNNTAGIDTVSVNLSAITGQSTIVSMTFDSGLWTATYSVNSTAGRNFEQANITLIVNDTQGNSSTGNNIASIILYEMTMPPSANATCEIMTDNTTNFCNIQDFTNVNFVMEIAINGSANCHDGQVLPWENTFKRVLTIDFASLDFSAAETVAKLQELGDAIRPEIKGPGQFGDSSIYVNSTKIAALDTNTTITLYNLPFAIQPNISGPGSENISSISSVLNAPYSFNNMTIPNMDLTFTVTGFSQYNITDNLDPIISAISPTDEAILSSNQTTLSATINGTGAQLYLINYTIDGVEVASWTSQEVFGAGCENETPNYDVVTCIVNVSALDYGAHNFSVTATDFGGATGNMRSEAIDFTVDNEAPLFTTLHGTTVDQNESVSVNIEATDDNNISCYRVNDTVNFDMNCGGNLTNISALTVKTYQLAIYVNDTLNNTASGVISIVVRSDNQSYANTSTVNVSNTTTSIIVDDSSPIENITIPSDLNDSEKIYIDFSPLMTDNVVTTTNNSIQMVRVDDTVNYSVTIPANTNLTGSAGWDGLLVMPTLNTTSLSVASGNVNVAIDFGTTTEVNFSNPVKIILGGMAGKKAGWTRGDSTVTIISNICDNVTNPVLTGGVRECYKDSGSDLVIFTKHFTTFVAYTSTSSGSSSGGGGGSSSSTVKACTSYWQCESWGSCINGRQKRICIDQNDCAVASSDPISMQSCTIAKKAVPVTQVPEPAAVTKQEPAKIDGNAAKEVTPAIDDTTGESIEAEGPSKSKQMVLVFVIAAMLFIGVVVTISAIKEHKGNNRQ